MYKLGHPKRLELPQWVQQQIKIQATEMAVDAAYQDVRLQFF